MKTMTKVSGIFRGDHIQEMCADPLRCDPLKFKKRDEEEI